MPDVSQIDFYELYMGQGMGHLITASEGSDVVWSMIADFGSDRPDPHTSESAKYVAGILNGMKGGPKLDLVIFSHSDKDHISIFPELLAEVKKRSGKKLPITEVIYGGDWENYDKSSKVGSCSSTDYTNLLSYIHNCFTTNVWHYGVNTTSYTRPLGVSTWKSTRDYKKEVLVYTLIANIPAAKPEVAKQFTDKTYPAHSINTASAVIMIVFAGKKYVVTGDATGQTMEKINTIFDGVGPFSDVVMLTVPHHGSERTAFDLTGSGPKYSKDENIKVITDFGNLINPESITVSAGRSSIYKHPAASILSFFWDNTRTANSLFKDPSYLNSHYYSAYFKHDHKYDVEGHQWPYKPDDDRWYVAVTKWNIYSNDYFYMDDLAFTDKTTPVLPPDPGDYSTPVVDSATNKMISGTPIPPEWVTWQYTTLANGTTTLKCRTTDGAAYPAAAGSAMSLMASGSVQPSLIRHSTLRSLRQANHQQTVSNNSAQPAMRSRSLRNAV